MKRFLTAFLCVLFPLLFTACEPGDAQPAEETIPFLEWIMVDGMEELQMSFAVRGEDNAEYYPGDTSLHALLLRCGFIPKQDDRELAVSHPFTLYFPQPDQSVLITSDGAQWNGHWYVPQGEQAFERLLQRLYTAPGTVRPLADGTGFLSADQVKNIYLDKVSYHASTKSLLAGTAATMLGQIPVVEIDAGDIQDAEDIDEWGKCIVDLSDNSQYALLFSTKGHYIQVQAEDKPLATYRAFPDEPDTVQSPQYYGQLYRKLAKLLQWAPPAVKLEKVDAEDVYNSSISPSLYAFDMEGLSHHQPIDSSESPDQYLSVEEPGEYALSFSRGKEDLVPLSVEVAAYSNWDDYAPGKAIPLEWDGKSLHIPMDKGQYILDITAQYEMGYAKFSYVYSVEYRESVVAVDNRYLQLAKETFDQEIENTLNIPACQYETTLTLKNGEARIMLFDSREASWGSPVVMIVETANGAKAHYIEYHNLAGDHTNIICADIDGDGAEELLIHEGVSSSGFGDWPIYDTVILRVTETQCTQLFSSRYAYYQADMNFDTGFRVTPLDGMQVKVSNIHTNYDTVVPGMQSWIYDDEIPSGHYAGIYDEDGRVVEDHRDQTYQNPDRGRFINLRIQDIDGDGASELFTAELVSMADNWSQDRYFGYGLSMMKYDAATGTMTVTRSQFVSFEEIEKETGIAGLDAADYLEEYLDRWSRE